VSHYFNVEADGKTIKDSTDLCEYLLNQASVALVPGIAFGDDGFVRLSYATSLDRIDEGLDRIEVALKRLA
jgi:aspartate aminotransferase